MKKRKKLIIILVSILVLILVNSFIVINKVNEGKIKVNNKNKIEQVTVKSLNKIVYNDYQTFNEKYEGKKVTVTDKIKDIYEGNINLVDDLEMLNDNTINKNDYVFTGYIIKLKHGLTVFVSDKDTNYSKIKKYKKHKKITVTGYLSIYDYESDFLISGIKTKDCTVKTTCDGDYYKCSLTDNIKID